MRTKQHRRTILVFRCPECGHEVEQQLFGTPHTASLACIDCETDMDRIPLSESKYEYDDELIEDDGEYTVEFEVPDGRDQLEDLKDELSRKTNKEEA